ncbi:MAG: hypothetical protein MJ161_02275 [Clostridia bacterium]|nr:hypothetical protein [Clostridia bacterium]
MMSASPAFAAEEQNAACDEQQAACEEQQAMETTSEPAESAEPAATEATEARETGETPETSGETAAPAQKQMVLICLTVLDENDNRILDEEKLEAEEGTSPRDFAEEIFRDAELKWQWEECDFEYNGEAVDKGVLAKRELKDEDRLVIIHGTGKDCSDETGMCSKGSEEPVMSIQATDKEISDSGSAAAAGTKTIIDADDWAWGNEWGIIGLARRGTVSDSCSDKYCISLATLLDENKSDMLSQSKSSDNARTILTLTALGYDPEDVNGYNLLEPLADMSYASQPYLSGPIWTLIAIDSHDYKLPKVKKGGTQTTRELLVQTILSARRGPGWAYSGGAPDVDMTCMAIQALAPYYRAGDASVVSAVDTAVAWLSTRQNAKGGFESFGDETSESASQVIAALTSVGINPNTDPRFVKNGKSVVDSLLSFMTEDGGFRHLKGGGQDPLASYQGCYALAALERLQNGENSLYDMRDVSLRQFTAEPKPQEEEDRPDNPEKDKDPAEKLAPAAQGRTFSLGGKTVSVSLTAGDEDILKEKGTSEKTTEMGYNSLAEKERLMSVLPWLYCGIGALAALALVIILRNRKSV